MKAQLEETVDAAMKVGFRRDESMAEDALRRGEDYLRLTIDTILSMAAKTGRLIRRAREYN